MKWINSLDELLYEIMSWLLFYPVTLWKAVTRPLKMMDYAESQLALADDEQYEVAVSPPLFLVLSLLLAHGISVALGQIDAIVADKHGLGGLINDEATALAFRVVIFSLFPLLAAAHLLRRKQEPLKRSSLRFPFYAQCYPAAVFALGISVGVTLISVAGPISNAIGLALALLSLSYFAVIETKWFAIRLATTWSRALSAMALVLSEGFGLLLFIGFLITR